MPGLTPLQGGPETTRHRILVAGVREVDSGKTTTAKAILEILCERGERPCGFKPRAGNTLWYDYDIVHEALSQGRLYGKDSRILREASATDLPEEALSPVHRLHGMPLEPGPLDITGRNGFVMDRASLWDKDPEQIVVLNENHPLDGEAGSLADRIVSMSDKVIRVGTVNELNSAISRYYSRAVRTAHNTVRGQHDTIVYESYADVALPWKGIRDLDGVFLVGPGRIDLHDPDRYLTAVRMRGGLLKEGSTRGLRDLLDPVETLRLPPLRSAELSARMKSILRPHLQA